VCDWVTAQFIRSPGAYLSVFPRICNDDPAGWHWHCFQLWRSGWSSRFLLLVTRFPRQSSRNFPHFYKFGAHTQTWRLSAVEIQSSWRLCHFPWAAGADKVSMTPSFISFAGSEIETQRLPHRGGKVAVSQEPRQWGVWVIFILRQCASWTGGGVCVCVCVCGKTVVRNCVRPTMHCVALSCSWGLQRKAQREWPT